MKQKNKNYYDSCKRRFWQDVFDEEINFILPKINLSDKILSVGCGPAVIENKLSCMGYRIVGIDISYESPGFAPKEVRTLIGMAENLPFADSTFDVVLFIASLQFVDDFKKAIEESVRVLKKKGKIIVLLLNPKSIFFKKRVLREDSYMHKIRFLDVEQIERKLNMYFVCKKWYFLGIDDKDNLFETTSPNLSAIVAIEGQLE
jgi:ubiquinone/menaquinone biosynthesis C-methylase UbiE